MTENYNLNKFPVREVNKWIWRRTFWVNRRFQSIDIIGNEVLIVGANSQSKQWSGGKLGHAACGMRPVAARRGRVELRRLEAEPDFSPAPWPYYLPLALAASNKFNWARFLRCRLSM